MSWPLGSSAPVRGESAGDRTVGRRASKEGRHGLVQRSARGIRARRIRWLSSFVAVLVAITCGSASAGATVVDRDRFTRSYDDVRWDCGYPLQVSGVESHKVQVRANKKLDGYVFVTDNYDVTEVWTAADGRSFTLSGNGSPRTSRPSASRIGLRVHLPQLRSARP